MTIIGLATTAILLTGTQARVAREAMDDKGIAPAWRGFPFLDTATFPSLIEAGLKPFDAAIRWSGDPR